MVEHSVSLKPILLGFSPLIKEDQLDHESHIDYLKFVLNDYAKTFENVAFLVGDNCSTNKKISQKLAIPL